jgi:hypothetical protein
MKKSVKKLTTEIIEKLKLVLDPELGVSIYDSRTRVFDFPLKGRYRHRHHDADHHRLPAFP